MGIPQVARKLEVTESQVPERHELRCGVMGVKSFPRLLIAITTPVFSQAAVRTVVALRQHDTHNVVPSVRHHVSTHAEDCVRRPRPPHSVPPAYA